MFNLNRAFFVKALDAERLLALMGLHSRYSSNWRLNVLRHQSLEHGVSYKSEALNPESKNELQERAFTEPTADDLFRVTAPWTALSASGKDTAKRWSR